MNTKNWLQGVRFYLALAIALLTLQCWWWARATYGATNLATIRLQEVYGWISLVFLAWALMIGPAYKLFPHLPAKVVARDARRMIGIGAAWFALLHAAISYAALFEWPNPATLATAYQQSLGLGLLGLIILLLMTLTSFDGAMRRLGPWWFRLHRLVYVAALVALLHAFMVGTHAAALAAVMVIGVVSAFLLAMHIGLVLRSAESKRLHVVTLTILAFLLVAVINYGVSQYLGYNIFLDGHEGYRP